MIKQSADENGTRPEQVQCNLDSLNSMVGAWLYLQRGLRWASRRGQLQSDLGSLNSMVRSWPLPDKTLLGRCLLLVECQLVWHGQHGAWHS